MTNETHFEDETPWADPKIRQEYEAALGKYLLIYNQIDFLLLQIAQMALSDLGREDLSKNISKEDFWLRIYTLDILKSVKSVPELSSFPTEKLKQLNGDRAILAHGHMEQNPFDGSYSLIVKGKDKGEHFSSEKIIRMADEAEKTWYDLRLIEAQYVFKPEI